MTDPAAEIGQVRCVGGGLWHRRRWRYLVITEVGPCGCTTPIFDTGTEEWTREDMAVRVSALRCLYCRGRVTFDPSEGEHP